MDSIVKISLHNLHLTVPTTSSAAVMRRVATALNQPPRTIYLTGNTQLGGCLSRRLLRQHARAAPTRPHPDSLAGLNRSILFLAFVDGLIAEYNIVVAHALTITATAARLSRQCRASESRFRFRLVREPASYLDGDHVVAALEDRWDACGLRGARFPSPLLLGLN